MNNTIDHFDIPIVVIVFNRPEMTEILFERISQVKPLKIYLISDGCRETIKNEDQLVQKSREVFTRIDWECHVERVFSDINLGCGRRVSTGLDYVFEREEYAIILEDDCIPNDSFFIFCREMLIRYRNDSRIVHISGSNFTEKITPQKYSYFFSYYGHIWGWATWARAWKNFDFNMSTYKTFREEIQIENFFFTKNEQSYFVSNCDNYSKDSTRPWGFRWFYARIVMNGLSIVPRHNLIRNIGINGTHINSYSSFLNRTTKDFLINSEIKHPVFLLRDVKYDQEHFRLHILETKFKYLKALKRIFHFIKTLIQIKINQL